MQGQAFKPRWRREMTGCPGLDREDSSRNRRWRRTTQGGTERSRELSKMERSSSSESARVLSRIRRPESSRTRTVSQAWVSRPTSSPAPGPDWQSLVPSGPTRSQAWPCQCLGKRSPAVLASVSPPTHWRPSRPSLNSTQLLNGEASESVLSARAEARGAARPGPTAEPHNDVVRLARQGPPAEARRGAPRSRACAPAKAGSNAAWNRPRKGGRLAPRPPSLSSEECRRSSDLAPIRACGRSRGEGLEEILPTEPVAWAWAGPSNAKPFALLQGGDGRPFVSVMCGKPSGLRTSHRPGWAPLLLFTRALAADARAGGWESGAHF